jgi:glycerophosphoryl diester phosphodiesterase
LRELGLAWDRIVKLEKLGADNSAEMPRQTRRRPTFAARTLVLAAASVALSGAAAESPVPQPFPTPFKVIAHRGASAYAPENTLPAYARALELGAVDVELDVQLSKDDVVILFHDSKLADKTGSPGRVRDYAAAQLLEMDIGTWFDRTHPDVEEKFAGTKLNSLAALFDAFGDQFHFHIELKSRDAELARLALEQVRAYRLEGIVRFTSFHFEQARRAREIAPQIPTGLLVRDAKRLRQKANVAKDAPLLPLQKTWVDRAVAAGFDQVGFPAEDLSTELVAYAVRKGLEIRAWRIQSDLDMRRAIRLGAYGMTTNWPDRLIRELLEHKRGHKDHHGSGSRPRTR